MNKSLLPRLLVLAVACLGLLAACDTPPPRPSFPDIRFTDRPPLRLDVAAIDIRNDYQPPYRSPDVEHIFPVPPARALENWGHDRLQAAGGTNRARLVIKTASVIEVELKKKSEGLRAALTTEPSQRYDAVIEATLDVVNDRGLPVRTASVKVQRSQSVLEGITPNDRDMTWYEMTKMLLTDFDQQMEAEIRGNFAPYLQ